MTHKPETLVSRDLLVEELDHLEGITEEEMATVSYVCSCTCSGALDQDAIAVQPDNQVVR